MSWKILTVACVVLMLASCKPCKYVSKHPECFPRDTVIRTNEIKVLDTVTYIEGHEAFLDVYLECDSLNQVLMKRVDKTDKGIKADIILKNNILKIHALTDSIEVLNRIIIDKELEKVIIMNPVNIQMKEDLSRCKDRTINWMKAAILTWIVIALLTAGILIYRRAGIGK